MACVCTVASPNEECCLVVFIPIGDIHTLGHSSVSATEGVSPILYIILLARRKCQSYFQSGEIFHVVNKMSVLIKEQKSVFHSP